LDTSFVASGQLPADIEVMFRKVFRHCDVARAGAFNECEMIFACSQRADVAAFLGLPQQLRAEDGSLDMATRMFQALDANQDYEVSWEEFRSFFTARFMSVLVAQRQALGFSATPCPSECFQEEEPFPCEQELFPCEQQGVAPEPAKDDTPSVGELQASVTVIREGAACRFCGKRMGLLFGAGGCGIHQRLHESRCGAKHIQKGFKFSCASVETDVPQDSVVDSSLVSR
jgi:hypothetical protein